MHRFMDVEELIKYCATLKHVAEERVRVHHLEAGLRSGVCAQTTTPRGRSQPKNVPPSPTDENMLDLERAF